MSGQINAQAGPSRTSSPSLRPRNPTIRPPSPLVHATPVALPPTSSSSFEPGAPSTTQHSPSKPTAPPLPPFLSRILATHHPPPQPSSPSYGPEAKPTPQSLYLPPPAIPDVEEDLVPPENFALVCKGVYRSGFPKKRNFGFMQTLGLKTILTLVLEDYPDANLKWCQAQDVQFMQFGIPGNKEPFDNIPEDVITSALCAILDKRNHPLLIHCNKGKHRTGCLVGCIRRTQSWSLTSIFDEYRRFSDPKSRAVDQQFIDLFPLEPVWDQILADPSGGGARNLPGWGMMTVPRRVRNAALRGGSGMIAGLGLGRGDVVVKEEGNGRDAGLDAGLDGAKEGESMAQRIMVEGVS